jgi:uncharacterized protein YegL
MPKISNQSGAIVKSNAGHFGFSAVKVGDLKDTEYTLATIITDVSGSVGAFKDALEAALKEIVDACRSSPRADNLLLRVVTFGSNVSEMHPWELLNNINPDDYTGKLQIGGMTALYDGCINGIEAVSNYGQDLSKQDYAVNGIIFVLTDGDENDSKFSDSRFVKQALEATVSGENLESCLSFLIGVNMTDPHMAQRLQDFQKEVGFTDFIKLDDASSNTLKKLAKFVSSSISSQSQALGSGGASKAINPSAVF